MPARTSHQLSADERLQTALERVASPHLEGGKVFTELFEAEAEREALAADERVAKGVSRGPLDGRIVSIKALFDVAGQVTTAGSALLRAQPPARQDAAVVQALRAAGAVIVGKTQMTEFAFSALGTNPHDGMPGNPRDRQRVPGGSSSGAVVSVVDGMAEIALGSDTGGSLRIPAALSGAVGFKPTGGRAATTGAFSLSSTLDTVGPIASNVADCALVDDVLTGRPPTPLAPAATDGFRLVVPRGRLFDDCEVSVAEAFEAGVERLWDAGVRVETGSLDTVLDAIGQIDALGTFPSVEVAATLRDLGVEGLDGVDPRTRVRIEAGAATSAVAYIRMRRLRAALVRRFEASVADDEIFILPTTPIRAPLISQVADAEGFQRANGLVLRNPRIANLLDCPSISLPLPADGLPVGLMLIGRRNGDRRLLEIAARLEAVLGRQAT